MRPPDIDRYVDLAELRRLVGAFLLVVGALVVAALFASIVVPGLRNANRPTPSANVTAPQGESGWLDPTEYPPAKGYEIPPVDPSTLLSPTPALLERGKALFAKNCAACHGEAGGGDGPSAKGLAPPPRNLTKPEGWKNGDRITSIFRTLEEGIRGSSMAAWDSLAVADRMALVHLVRSLGGPTHPPENPVELESLSKKLARGGERVPNKIPVGQAMERLVEEQNAIPPIPLESDVPLLARIVLDPARAASALAASPDWRKGPAELAKAISSGTPANGFAPSVALLSPEEWRELHLELSRRVR